MKKVLSILMVFCVCFAFSSCKKESEKTDTYSGGSDHSVDVVKLASSGRIPEVEFLLGDSVEAVKNELFRLSAGMTHEEFCDNMREAGYEPDGSEYSGYVTETSVDGHTVMASLYNEDTSSSVYGLYSNDNVDAGISAIAVVGEVYGFDGNTVMEYVKNAMGEKYTEEKSNSKFYFLPKSEENAVCLTYELGAHKLELYFSQYNTFVAAVLYDVNIW